MRFYSQHGEDKALERALFGSRYRGYFVDVGALDGIGRSNTYLFYLFGWSGICIEPHLQFFQLLKKNQPGSICLNVAAWDKNVETSDFYATKAGTWSTVGGPPPQDVLKKLGANGWYARAQQAGIQLQHPKLRTLDFILGKYKAPRRFDLLSIDVENSEEHVLKGFSLDRYLPRVVIIEDHFNTGFPTHFDPLEYIPVRRKGSQNTIYCRDPKDAKKLKEKWV